MGKDLIDGKCATSPSFVTVGALVEGVRGIYLTELVPSGAETMTLGENLVQIQLLGPQGQASEIYTYHKGDKRPYKTDGWYNKLDELVGTDVDDVFLAVGTGLWMEGNSSLKFTTSGEVLLDSQLFKLIDGKRLVANPYPSKVQLSKFIPEGADVMTLSENLVQAQVLGPQGQANEVYTYHKGDKRPYKTDGWYNKLDELVGTDVPDVSFDPGTSLWTEGNKNITITIVTPFEDAE